jgi:hypothetical protein
MRAMVTTMMVGGDKEGEGSKAMAKAKACVCVEAAWFQGVVLC